jgi:hypothetical protein
MDITRNITEAILSKTPISFCKYGDGEYYCANSYEGRNCDNDDYNERKKDALIKSFQYTVDEMPNAYIGFWPWIYTDTIKAYWEGLTKKPIQWAHYLTIVMDHNYNRDKILLYKTIKESPMKKIYICNPLLIKARNLFNIDYMIHVPFRNWFDSCYDNIMNQLKTIIQPNEQYIVMMSAGIAAKILIADLSRLFPNNIYLDFGSAIDKICTKKTTRGWEPSYETLMEWLHEIIPDDWNDPKYDSIYEEAKKELGLHMY